MTRRFPIQAFFVSLTALLAVLSAFPAQAYGPAATFTTGRDWKERMSPIEKFLSVAAPMYVLNRYGVPFRHAPHTYVSVLEKVIRANPGLLHEDVTNIFASTLYLLEPESRASLDGLEGRFLRGQFETTPLRLLVPQPD